MHSAPPPTTSGEATRPRFRPAPEAPWTGAAGTAWADAPRPGAAGPPWTGAARAWATTGTGEACPGGAMAPISHPGAADHGPGEGLVCARTGRGPTPVTTPSAARTGTWRSSAPLLPAGRGPSDPQQGSDLVEDLDGLVDGGRRHDGGELLPGLGRAGGAPGDVGQKMRHEGPQRGAREPVRDKGRAVLARAGPVSSSMRTTPTAYRSWAGSGPPRTWPRGTRGRACRSPGSPARAGAPRWAPPCRSPRGRCPARSPGAAGCRRASVAVDEPCRVDDVEGLEQLADGRQHPGLRQRAVVAQQPRRGAAVHERHGEDDAVVLDASGSMASEDGTGTPTIDAARKSLTSLVDSLPTDAKVGMRVLGATVNTDPMPAEACDDTQRVVDIASGNRAQLISAIGKYSPNGWTPIPKALEQVGTDRGGSGKRSNVLVSDGESPCGDPCPTAESLAFTGVDLTIDVVGLSVDETTRQQLQCVADKGKYYGTPGPDQGAAAGRPGPRHAPLRLRRGRGHRHRQCGQRPHGGLRLATGRTRSPPPATSPTPSPATTSSSAAPSRPTSPPRR